MKRTLTIKEYKTRAMLLGMYYAPRAHCFFYSFGSNKHNDKWFDADTLEPVDQLERARRREEYLNETQVPIHRQND